MRDVPEVLEGSAFLLERIRQRICRAINLDARPLKLDSLARRRRLDDLAVEAHARTRSNLLECVRGDDAFIDDHLQIAKAGAIAKLNKRDPFAVSTGFYPSVSGYLRPRMQVEQVADVGSAIVHVRRILPFKSSAALRTLASMV